MQLKKQIEKIGFSTFICGDARRVLKTFEDNFFDCVVTSPPYWRMRQYEDKNELGWEDNPDNFVERLCWTIEDLLRVVKETGIFFLNIGDTRFEGEMAGIPWKTAFALKDMGWRIVQEIIWPKLHPRPHPVYRRCAMSHDQIFILAKSEDYFFDHNAIRMPVNRANRFGVKQMRVVDDHKEIKQKRGKDVKRKYLTMRKRITGKVPGSVWYFEKNSGKRESSDGFHVATFPLELPVRCIKAGCPPEGIVLDPFGGTGTTLVATSQLGREGWQIELSREYHEAAIEKLKRKGQGKWRESLNVQ